MTVAAEKFVWHQRTHLFQIAWPGWTEMVRKVSGHFENRSVLHFAWQAWWFAHRRTGIITRVYMLLRLLSHKCLFHTCYLFTCVALTRQTRNTKLYLSLSDQGSWGWLQHPLQFGYSWMEALLALQWWATQKEFGNCWGPSLDKSNPFLYRFCIFVW